MQAAPPLDPTGTFASCSPLSTKKVPGTFLCAFIAKGTGVLLVPVPKLEDLRGIAKGADPRGAGTGATGY